jgi:hypothetical protein
MEKYLAPIGGTLTAAAIVWVTSSQLSVTTQLALIQQTQNQQDTRLGQVWPRLRTHGENIHILRDQVENICQCDISLSEPERF